MEYKKNKDGTYSIISETEEIVKLEELEQELANLQQLKNQADEFNAWVDTLDESKKTFIQKQYFVIPEGLEKQIEEFKKLN